MTHVRLLIVVLAAAAVGCTSGERLIEVKGRVLIGDKPAGNGMGYVTFHPDDKKGNKSLEEAVSAIQPDGSYTLITREKPGAALGWYKVAVTIAEVIDPKNPYVTKWLMPQPDKYVDWRKSGIEIEVVESPQPGQYDIKLPPLGG